MGDSNVMTTEELAAYLGLANVTLRQWRSWGKGPQYIRDGRFIRYRKTDVDKWLETYLVETEGH